MIDQKQTYKELIKQNETLKKKLQAKKSLLLTNLSLFDHMLEGCQIISDDWRYVYLNNSAIGHSEKSRKDLLGKKITDVWPGFEKTGLYKVMKECFDFGTPKRFEYSFHFPGGKTSWYDLSIQRIPEGLFILTIDISDKKKIANILSDESKKFQIVFEHSNIAKSITKPGGELEANQAFCKMLGYTKDELKNKKWQDITPKDEIVLTEKKLAEIFSGKTDTLHLKKQYIHKKGHRIWGDVNVAMHRDNNRNPLFFITEIVDITKQKESEELILYQKELLEEMGSIAKIGAWEFDAETGKGTWTDETAKIHDLEPGVETNVEFGTSFYPEDSRKKIDDAIKKAIEEKKPYELELELISAKGNKKWIRTHGKPIIKNNKVAKVRGSFQDISERKIIENKLRDNEWMLKTLLGNLPGVAYRCRNNENWEMEYLSDGCFLLTGYTPGELSGNSKLTFNDLIHPEDQKRVWEKVQTAINNNISFELEYRIITKNKKIKWVWERGKKTNNNNPEILEGFISDITKNKLAQIALTESQERFSKTFHSSPAGLVISLVENNKYIDVNESFANIIGYRTEEIIGSTYRDLKLLTKSSEKQIEKEFHKKGNIRNIELQLNSKSGKEITVLFSNDLIELNSVLCRISTIIDITDRKQALEALRENEKRLQNAQSIAKIGDYIWDVEKDKISFSNSLKNILGYTKNEVIDLDFVRKNIHHPEDTEKTMNWMQSNLRSNSNILTPFEYRVVKKDGTPIHVRALGIIKRKNDKPIQVITTIQDITEYKLAVLEINKLNHELEKRVKERTAQLESINNELKTFTYTVSHDLKAPLRGIDGYSKLLEETYYNNLDDEGKLFINNIREGTMQMGQLIDDLLAYSRLERNEIAVATIKGKELIDTILRAYQNTFEEKKLCINTDFDEFTIKADYNSISMAIRNLIDNAVKFTKDIPQPEITIGYYESNTISTIYVKDNGIGFDQKYHNKIFEIFQRLQRVEKYPGTGIGLALVSKAMYRLGGRVYARSEPGKGATFYLELPKI